MDGTPIAGVRCIDTYSCTMGVIHAHGQRLLMLLFAKPSDCPGAITHSSSVFHRRGCSNSIVFECGSKVDSNL